MSATPNAGANLGIDSRNSPAGEGPAPSFVAACPVKAKTAGPGHRSRHEADRHGLFRPINGPVLFYPTVTNPWSVTRAFGITDSAMNASSPNGDGSALPSDRAASSDAS